jgi:hypothetical protein
LTKTWWAVACALALAAACDDEDAGVLVAGDASVAPDAGHTHGDDAGHADDAGHTHEADAAAPDAGHTHEVDAAAPDAGHTPEADGGDVPADGGADAGTPPDPAVVAYCDCMLVTCHDLYHMVWGADEVEARNACFEAAAGDEALACHMRACHDAIDDEARCPAAGGVEICE